MSIRCHHAFTCHLLADPPPPPSGDDVIYEQPLIITRLCFISKSCEISFILQLRKGFWETFTEWEEEEGELDPEEEDKRRRKEMEEEGIALMGRFYKMMMIINKYDGKISTYAGQVVQAAGST